MTTTTRTILSQYNTTLTTYQTDANSYNTLITIIDEDLTLSEKDDQNYTTYKTNVQNAIAAINGLQQYSIDLTVNYDLTLQMQTDLNTIEKNFSEIETNFKSLNIYYTNKLSKRFRTLHPIYTPTQLTSYTNSNISPLLYSYDYDSTKPADSYWSNIDLDSYSKYLDINNIYYPSTYDSYSKTFYDLMTELNKQYTLDYTFDKSIKEIFSSTITTDENFIDINIFPNVWETSIENIDNTLNQYLKPRTIDKAAFTTMGSGSNLKYYMSGYFYTQNIYDETSTLINTSLTPESGTDVTAQLTKLNNAINYLNTVNNGIAKILQKIKDTAKIIADASDTLQIGSDIYKNYIRTYETTFLKSDLYLLFDNSNQDKDKIAKYFRDTKISDYKRIIIYLFSAYFLAEPLNKKTALQTALSEIINTKFTITSNSGNYELYIDFDMSKRIRRDERKNGSQHTSKKKYVPVLDVWYNTTQLAPAIYVIYPTISTNSYYTQNNDDPLKNNNTFHNQKFIWELADPDANLTSLLQVPSASSTTPYTSSALPSDISTYESMYTSVSNNKDDLTENYPNMDHMVYIKKCPSTTTTTITSTTTSTITSEIITTTLIYTKCVRATPISYYKTTRNDIKIQTDTINAEGIITATTTTVPTTSISNVKLEDTELVTAKDTYDSIVATESTARDIVRKPIVKTPSLDTDGVSYNWDIFYNFKNYTSTKNYKAGSLNEYWNNAMCYVSNAVAGTETIINKSVENWLVHSNKDDIASTFPRLLDIMDVVALNERKIFVPLIKLLNNFLNDNKYDIISYDESGSTLTYKNTSSGLEQTINLNPSFDSTNKCYSTTMEDIILMLKMVNLSKNDSTIQSQNLHQMISIELCNLLDISYLPIDTSNNSSTTNIHTIGGTLQVLLFDDINNTIQNANKLTNKSSVTNAYEIESNTTYSTYASYRQIISDSSYRYNEVTENNYKIYIKLRRPNKDGYENDAYYCNVTTETAITEDPISGIAYLTTDYTATGTRLETYTLEDLNKALRVEFKRLRCFYIDSRPSSDPSTDPNYDLYTVLDIPSDKMFSYFAYFVPSVGEVGFKLVTKCIGHDSTGSTYLTKPDGWIYTPYKVYNPVITVNGGLEGLLEFYSETTRTTKTTTTKDSTFIKTTTTSNTKCSDGTYISYKFPTYNTSFSATPATKSETISTTTITYKSLSTEENYRESGIDMTRTSSLSQSSITASLDAIADSNKTTMESTLTAMQGYQETMVNCSIITTEIDFATGIITIDSDFINIRATLNSALAGYSSNTTVSAALASLDTFYNDYTAIPIGKTTNMVTDATTILTRYSPITTLNNLTYISDIFDTTETTVLKVISIDPEISFIDRIKARCDEMKSLAENFYNLSEALTSTINPFVQYLIDFLVNETNIMKVDIDNKYNSLSSSDPNKTNALTTKTTVDNYYTTSSTLATGFSTSTTKTTDLTTIKNNFNTTLNTLEPEMDGHLKSSIDRSLIPAMQTIQANVNATYQTISAQDPANAHLTEATALNDDVNTRVTNTLAIQSGWSASITKISDYLEVKNNYASIQLDEQQINTYV